MPGLSIILKPGVEYGEKTNEYSLLTLKTMKNQDNVVYMHHIPTEEDRKNKTFLPQRVTFAAVHRGHNAVDIAVSCCCETDQFSKQVGRDRARIGLNIDEDTYRRQKRMGKTPPCKRWATVRITPKNDEVNDWDLINAIKEQIPAVLEDFDRKKVAHFDRIGVTPGV